MASRVKILILGPTFDTRELAVTSRGVSKFSKSGSVGIAGLMLLLGGELSWAGPPNRTSSDNAGNTAARHIERSRCKFVVRQWNAGDNRINPFRLRVIAGGQLNHGATPRNELTFRSSHSHGAGHCLDIIGTGIALEALGRVYQPRE